MAPTFWGRLLELIGVLLKDQRSMMFFSCRNFILMCCVVAGQNEARANVINLSADTLSYEFPLIYVFYVM